MYLENNCSNRLKRAHKQLGLIPFIYKVALVAAFSLLFLHNLITFQLDRVLLVSL